MIVGKGSIKEEWKDCASCQKFNRETFVCSIYGYGTLADKLYLSCGQHIKR